ncbi:MAG TPA: thiamine pyrophosphate-dependent enzyme [Candidatus Limnocylindria bacterium]|jgi:2-oxoglutarate ferredoxin oxidoreductase subunit beta|nr:thiamine pyrophosphate-dependent enzyme [Candidatus Limnocylindria bacterium]
MPEAPMAELGYKEHLKLDLFPTIWCPGCGIGTIMLQLAMVLDEMGMDETNTIIVTGIGCTGRMGGYMKYESVYTLHGRTMPVAEAIKTVRPEMNLIVVAGDGDTASIGGNHLIHAIRRNAPITVLCNNNEIYGLTGGQTGPTTPTGTKTLSSPAGNPNTPINLQGLVRSSPHSLYAKTTVYHQLHMRNVIREAIEHPGFAFVDITSQCIENNGRRIGFASANDMLTFYRKTYKRAAKGAERLNPFEIGVLYPKAQEADGTASANGNGTSVTTAPERPAALPEQPSGPMQSTAEAPAARPPADDDEKARKRAESQERAALMAQLAPDTKLRIARREISLVEALTAAGIEVPEFLRTGASAPAGAPVAAGEVQISESGADPATEAQPTELDAQKAESVAEGRDLVGGAPGGDPQPVAPRTFEDAAPPLDAAAARKDEAQRKLALMQKLPSELKLRVAKRELTLEEALREAGVEPEE